MPPNEQEENQVTKDTMFEQRGFMADITADDGKSELTAEEADKQAAAMQAGGAAEAESQASDENVEASDMPTSGAAKKQAKVRIGTQEFETTEEAWAYAQELEQKQIASDAFRQGVEAAGQSTPGNLVQTPPQEEKLDPEFYTDPANFLKKRDAKIAAEIEARVTQGLSMKERNAKTWSDFYRAYPDLGKAEPLVQLVLNQEWNQLKHVETGKALKIIAEKTRAMKREMLADEMPGRELPKVTQAASAGRGTGVTSKAPDEQALNFTQQLRNMRKNKIARMRR